jgi:hypothetical protein
MVEKLFAVLDPEGEVGAQLGMALVTVIGLV